MFYLQTSLTMDVRNRKAKRACIVPDCRFKYDKKAVCFQIPEQSQLIWLYKINNNELWVKSRLNKRLYICSKHFEPHELELGTANIAPHVLPTLNLHNRACISGNESLKGLNTQVTLKLHHMCFICMRNREGHDIYKKWDPNSGTNRISDIVTKITNIQVPPSGNPTVICAECLCELRIAYQFRIKYESSYNIWKKHYAPCIIEEEIIDVDNYCPKAKDDVEDELSMDVKLEIRKQITSVVNEVILPKLEKFSGKLRDDMTALEIFRALGGTASKASKCNISTQTINDGPATVFPKSIESCAMTINEPELNEVNLGTDGSSEPYIINVTPVTMDPRSMKQANHNVAINHPNSVEKANNIINIVDIHNMKDQQMKDDVVTKSIPLPKHGNHNFGIVYPDFSHVITNNTPSTTLAHSSTSTSQNNGETSQMTKIVKNVANNLSVSRNISVIKVDKQAQNKLYRINSPSPDSHQQAKRPVVSLSSKTYGMSSSSAEITRDVPMKMGTNVSNSLSSNASSEIKLPYSTVVNGQIISTFKPSTTGQTFNVPVTNVGTSDTEIGNPSPNMVKPNLGMVTKRSNIVINKKPIKNSQVNFNADTASTLPSKTVMNQSVASCEKMSTNNFVNITTNKVTKNNSNIDGRDKANVSNDSSEVNNVNLLNNTAIPSTSYVMPLIYNPLSLVSVNASSIVHTNTQSQVLISTQGGMDTNTQFSPNSDYFVTTTNIAKVQSNIPHFMPPQQNTMLPLPGQNIKELMNQQQTEQLSVNNPSDDLRDQQTQLTQQFVSQTGTSFQILPTRTTKLLLTQQQITNSSASQQAQINQQFINQCGQEAAKLLQAKQQSGNTSDQQTRLNRQFPSRSGGSLRNVPQKAEKSPQNIAAKNGILNQQAQSNQLLVSKYSSSVQKAAMLQQARQNRSSASSQQLVTHPGASLMNISQVNQVQVNQQSVSKSSSVQNVPQKTGQLLWTTQQSRNNSINQQGQANQQLVSHSSASPLSLQQKTGKQAQIDHLVSHSVFAVPKVPPKRRKQAMQPNTNNSSNSRVGPGLSQNSDVEDFLSQNFIAVEKDTRNNIPESGLPIILKVQSMAVEDSPRNLKIKVRNISELL